MLLSRFACSITDCGFILLSYKNNFHLCRPIWRKRYAFKEKKREVEFRQRLIAKVHEAEKFDAEKFVDDYLEDNK